MTALMSSGAGPRHDKARSYRQGNEIQPQALPVVSPAFAVQLLPVLSAGCWAGSPACLHCCWNTMAVCSTLTVAGGRLSFSAYRSPEKKGNLQVCPSQKWENWVSSFGVCMGRD